MRQRPCWNIQNTEKLVVSDAICGPPELSVFGVATGLWPVSFLRLIDAAQRRGYIDLAVIDRVP
jgi:hypothetical protein